jgi:hypothetical protein
MKPGTTICEAVSRNGNRCTKAAVTKFNGKSVCHLHSPALMAKRTAKMKRRGIMTGAAAVKAKREAVANGNGQVTKKRAYVRRAPQIAADDAGALADFGVAFARAIRTVIRSEFKRLAE